MGYGEGLEDEDVTFGRRCAVGCESWPDDDDYIVCPCCGEQTTRYNNLNPLSEEEAHKIKCHVLFEDFYEHEWPALRPKDNPEMEDCQHLLHL